MIDKKIILVKTPDCSQCKAVISLIEQKGLEIEVVDATVEVERISVFETMSVPFIAIEEENNSQKNVKAIGGAQCMAFINQL